MDQKPRTVINVTAHPLMLPGFGSLQPRQIAAVPDSEQLEELIENAAVEETVDVPVSGELTPASEVTVDDLEAMKVPQLRALADQHGIDLGDATRKADVIAVIGETFRARTASDESPDPPANPTQED